MSKSVAVHSSMKSVCELFLSAKILLFARLCKKKCLFCIVTASQSDDIPSIYSLSKPVPHNAIYGNDTAKRRQRHTPLCGAFIHFMHYICCINCIDVVWMRLPCSFCRSFVLMYDLQPSCSKLAVPLHPKMKDCKPSLHINC